MKAKILLQAKGIADVFENVELIVDGKPYHLEAMLVSAMEKSEGFYIVVKEALLTYEAENKKGKN